METETPDAYRFDIQIRVTGFGRNSDEAFTNALQSLQARKWPETVEITGEVNYSVQEIVLPLPTEEPN